MAEAAAQIRRGSFWQRVTENISKKVLDAILVGDDAEALAVMHSAIEDFAQQIAHVTRRFLKTKAWEKTERIVVGGGFRNSQLGELAIARTEIILKAENFKIEMLPIRHHPDDAGLIVALKLAPSWIFEGHDFDSLRRHWRHQYPLRRRRNTQQEGTGLLQSKHMEVRIMAPRRRRAEPRGGGKASRQDA